MATAYIGLGANLGDRRAAIAGAAEAIQKLDSTAALRLSALYASPSLGATGPDYLNAVIELRTVLGPFELLAQLQRIEAEHGRERTYRNAPRTLDLDLLVYGDRVLATAALTLPHPRLHERAFALVPLAAIAPQLRIPNLGAIADLLPAVAGQPINEIDS